MAKTTPAAGTRAARTDDEKATKRVVLQKQRVLVLPPGLDVQSLVELKDEKELRKLIGAKLTEAWSVVGEFEGASKQAAIEAYAGKPGTPDAKVGTFKAPTASAFAGGRRYEAPPKPLVQAGDID